MLRQYAGKYPAQVEQTIEPSAVPNPGNTNEPNAAPTPPPASVPINVYAVVIVSYLYWALLIALDALTWRHTPN